MIFVSTTDEADFLEAAFLRATYEGPIEGSDEEPEKYVEGGKVLMS